MYRYTHGMYRYIEEHLECIDTLKNMYRLKGIQNEPETYFNTDVSIHRLRVSIHRANSGISKGLIKKNMLGLNPNHNQTLILMMF